MTHPPSIRDLIVSVGVQLRERTCSCCLEQRLYEIDATPALKPGERQELFYVCARCDTVARDNQ